MMIPLKHNEVTTEKKNSVLMPLLGLVFVLAISLGCTQLIQALVVQNSRTFDLNYIVLWSYPVATLFSVGSLLLLFWAVMTRTSRSKWIGAIYLIVGLWVITLPLTYLYFGSIISELPFVFYLSNYSINTVFFFTGGGIAITGLFSLTLPKNGD